MAIIIQTRNPRQLLNKINLLIDSQHIKTWIYDEEGDYTIVSPQWRYRAWMHPILPGSRNNSNDDFLIFGIVASKKYDMTKEIYGVFHGRFIATLLSHFDVEMEDIRSTPLLLRGVDQVSDC